MKVPYYVGVVFFKIYLFTGFGRTLDYRWAVSLVGAYTESGNEVAVDTSGNIFVIGMFWGVCCFL